MADFQAPLLNSFEEVDRISRYAKFAPQYDALMVKWDYDLPSQTAEYVKTYGSGPQAKILDVGCGTGLVGKALAKAGYGRISGIDISPDMLKFAEETESYQVLRQHDLTQFPYPFEDNTFPIVTAIGVLSTFEDIASILNECCRMATPGGCLIFTLRKTPLMQFGYRDQIKQLEQDNVMECIEVSEFTKLLPNHDEYKDDESCSMVYKVL